MFPSRADWIGGGSSATTKLCELPHYSDSLPTKQFIASTSSFDPINTVKKQPIFLPNHSTPKHSTMAESLVNEWVGRAQKFGSADMKALETVFAELDAHLTLRSYIIGHSLTEADTAVYKQINSNNKAKSYQKQGLFRNVSRWYSFIEETNPDLKAAALPIRTKGAPDKAGDNFEIGLQGAENGVVTRFPPEPS